MPALNEITQIINANLANKNFSTRKFQGAAYYAIADQVKTTGDEDKIEPMIIDDQGECTKMVYNDNYPFQIFHLIDTINYAIADPDYGPVGTTMEETANMTLVFVGNKKRLQTRSEDIAAAIMMDMPKEFQPSDINIYNLNSCIFETEDVETDPYKVWSQLWQGTKSFVKPETILITLKYKIITTYNRNCWKLCPTLPEYP